MSLVKWVFAAPVFVMVAGAVFGVVVQWREHCKNKRHRGY